MAHKRKIACHNVLVGKRYYAMMVIHLEDGFVTYITYLEGEEPSTEWLTGTIVVDRDLHDRLVATYRGQRLR